MLVQALCSFGHSAQGTVQAYEMANTIILYKENSSQTWSPSTALGWFLTKGWFFCF